MERGVSVVVVEDHGVLGQQVTVLLCDAGVRVLALASSAREGLDAVLHHLPDVAIVASRLPDGRGVDLVRAMRRAVPQVAILLHALALTPADEQEALAAGADEVVLASVRGADLLGAVLAHGRPRHRQ